MLNVKANDINIKPIKYSPSAMFQMPNPTSNKDNTIEIFDNNFNFFILNFFYPYPSYTLKKIPKGR